MPDPTRKEARPSFPARVRRLLGRIRRSFAIDVYDVFTRSVPAGTLLDPPEGYEFVWGRPEDVARCDPRHTDLDERERREGVERLGFGHRVVLGLHRGEPVFTMWMNPRNLNVPGLLKRRLGPHQWFIYKAYTSPEHRGKKLYETGMRFVLIEMERAGLTELVGYAHVKKTVSRKGLAALSFGTAGRVVHVNWPFLKTSILSRRLVSSFPEALSRSGSHGVRQTAPTP